jgi:cell division protein FtsB
LRIQNTHIVSEIFHTIFQKLGLLTLWSWLRRINFYVLAIVVFIVWIFFFDRNDILSQYKMGSQLDELKQQKKFFEKGIAHEKQEASELFDDNKKLEKYAREHYLMRKDSEDVYFIEEKKE